MIRDLEYPADAQKVSDSLLRGLEYDAAFAVFGNSATKFPPVAEGPDFSTGVRFGGREADLAVRRDLPGLCARFAVLSMITRIEEFSRLLYLQRLVLEELKNDTTRMTPEKLWPIYRRVVKDMIRVSATDVVTKLVVRQPSEKLTQEAEWLTGLTRIRNCLAHRRGLVHLEDVRPPGTPLEQVKDTDTLRVTWIRVKASIDGQEVASFPHTVTNKAGSELNVSIEKYARSWKVKEMIHITPLECQGVAMSLSVLGKCTLAEFLGEMNRFLKEHNPGPQNQPEQGGSSEQKT